MSNNEENPAILKDLGGGEVALKGVTISGKLSGLLANIQVAQTYLNPQDRNIETVYTFPLPLGAVLLGLEVEIAGKNLVGKVVERLHAEQAYEDAVTDGNSAVMLEEAGPGLYTANLGNLMAHETAVIRYRYGLPLVWHGNRLRFLLPTTIAPRYGDPGAAGLQPHQIPTASLMANYPLNLSILLEGELAEATIACPSHPIALSRAENGVLVQLSGKGVLDRDFVLTLESQHPQSACLAVADEDGQVVMASLRVPPLAAAKQRPIRLKVVIDCSGSMAGTSIAQARKAALEILNELGPSDSFNITLFGSRHEHVFKGMVKASPKHISGAWQRLEQLQANMGGTEMESALNSVFSLDESPREGEGEDKGQAALLLITDGEIYGHEALVHRATTARHRIFVVGVGNAVSEAFLKNLANATGGACELVAPQEGMAESVLSQFHRIRQPKLGTPKIEWPRPPTWQTPLPANLFAGDTLHVFAGFPQGVSGALQLHIPGIDPAQATLQATLQATPDPDIPRIAAANRLPHLPAEAATELAVKHQLLSRWTNFLVVAERDAQAEALPALHRIPQMLAAGWGNTGQAVFGAPAPLAAPAAAGILDIPQLAHAGRTLMKRLRARFEPLDQSAPPPKALIPTPPQHSPRQFVERLQATAFLNPSEPKLPTTLGELEALHLHGEITDALRRLINGGLPEPALILAFLNALAQSAIRSLFETSLRRHILKRWKDKRPEARVNLAVAELVKTVTPESWK